MEITPELLLGIFGSVTGLMGAAGLIVQILKYLKEKPKVEAEVRDARHFYIDDGKGMNTYQLSFNIAVRVKNKGDRGTTIGDAELNVTVE